MTGRRGRPASIGLLAPLLGALLQAQPTLAQGLSHDSSLPIEITADSLEVVQEERVATFAGNVDAVQGDLTLSADELRVHYSGDDPSSQDSPARSDEEVGAIRLIEAEGNVFLTSPRETAQGEVGVYDVIERLVTLEGSVVLTRDDNVIRGQRLEYDLASGRSRVLSASAGDTGGAPAERVRAIFVPERLEDPAPPAAGPGAAVREEPASADRGPPAPAPKPDLAE